MARFSPAPAYMDRRYSDPDGGEFVRQRGLCVGKTYVAGRSGDVGLDLWPLYRSQIASKDLFLQAGEYFSSPLTFNAVMALFNVTGISRCFPTANSF